MELINDIFSIFRKGVRKPKLNGELPKDIKNPWPGLSPYKDPIESVVQRKFCGRDKEIFELTRMIDENIFVTLYGKSGNGKTSLLNAGVFPQLRRMQYIPINIRLGMDAIGMSFQQCIIRQIEKYFTEERIEERWVIQPISDRTSENYLWNYFARHRFFADNRHETIVYPVITLDQFEEVYRSRRNEADILLRQINYLADKSHKLEDRYLNDGLYTYEYNFRFLVSIREDDLYLLEDSIDNNMLYPMKETRYRLRSLSPQGAKDVIFIPGEGLFDNAEKTKIAKTIIDLARGKNNDEISSNVLSLICNRIYVNYLRTGGNGYISYNLINSFISDNPLEKFYIEATAHLTNSERSYLEDNLVDIAGRRGWVSQANFEQIFKKKGASLLSGPQKILQENNDRIELIHDSFCQVLIDQKNKRLDRWRTFVEHLALMAMVGLLYYRYSLFHPFLNSLEPQSFVEVLMLYAMGCIGYFSLIFLLIVIGVVRKSFPTSFSWFAALILLIPTIADVFMNPQSVNLPLPYHIATAFLAGFTLWAHIYNLRNRPKDPESRYTYYSLLDIRSLKLWALVYLCFLVYYYVYEAPNGWYVSNTAFTVYLVIIPSLFYSVFDNENGHGWGVILLLFIPIAFIVYYTSDTEFLVLSEELPTLSLLLLLYFLYLPIETLWAITDDFESTTNRVLVIIIFIAIIFGLYALLYQYKLAMLAVWCLLTLTIVYLMCRDENKYESLICIATFIVTIGLFIFSKGYNPMIKNVNIAEQKGEWHWNMVMAKSDQFYHIYDGWTGCDLLGIGFDFQDENKNLVKKLNHNIDMNYEIVNNLFEISGADSTITFKSHPIFEQYISRESDKNSLSAIIFQQHRKKIFNDFINTKHHHQANQDSKIIKQLSLKEQEMLENTLSSNNDSIIKHNISHLLCKALSSSWLNHATDSVGVIGDMYYFNYLCAFIHFTESHFYTQIYEEKNTDWDGTFEELAVKYIECIDSIRTPSRDKVIEKTLPRLIEIYNNTNDYGLKTLLYGKIIRMQQIAILHGLGREKWARYKLSSSIGVDINKFYLEHRFR